jgi:hypothetical protein
MSIIMKTRLILFSFILLSFLTFIGWVFWEQEVKYTLPAPIPIDFVGVEVGEKIDLKDHMTLPVNQPVLLHFFSFDCACSRFNMKEFERLSIQQKDEINFMVVIQSDDADDLMRFEEKYALDNVSLILDKDGAISDICGIYATPQAVILDRESQIYFKGNYNKARFCTKKQTKYVDMALTHLLKNEPLPLYLQFALTEPYGCSLPSDEGHHHGDDERLFAIF